MKTEIKAANAGDLFIMPMALKPVCQQSRIFHTVTDGGAVIVNCISPYRSGQIEIIFGAVPQHPTRCAFASKKNASEFDIPAGVDRLTLVHDPHELKLTYDSAADDTLKEKDSGSKSVSRTEPVPIAGQSLSPKPEPVPVTGPKPEAVSRPETTSGTSKKAFAELQDAFARAIEEASGHVSASTDKQLTAIRQQITERMLEPYRSSDRHQEAILAEQLLYISRCILREIIDETQEEADQSTLPK